MQCPLDNTELVMAERQGIEIDYCPKCRGVWLDRGELDKIIERSAPEESYQKPRDDEPRYGRPEHRSDQRPSRSTGPTRRKSRCSARFLTSERLSALRSR